LHNRQFLRSRQPAAAHSSGGQNRPQDQPLLVKGGQTWAHPTEAHSTGGLLSRYRLGSVERGPQVYLGGGPQQEAAWRPRDDYRRHAAENLPDDHSKADPELCLLTGPLLMRLLVHFPVHFWVRAEASVLHGKANGCGPRYTEDGVRIPLWV
jgi:hypothetical protein